MALTTGRDCKAYVDDTGEVGDGTWVLLDEIRDVSTTRTANTAESQRRGRRHVGEGQTSLVVSVSFSIERDRSASWYDVMRTAWENGTSTGFAFMDGAIATSGVEGTQMDSLVKVFSEPEPLDDVSTIDVEIVYHMNGTLEPTHTTIA